MKYINKFLSSLLLTGLVSQSLFAAPNTMNEYIPLRAYAESVGYKVTWQTGTIILENSNAPTITLDLKNNSDAIIIKYNVTYADKECYQTTYPLRILLLIILPSVRTLSKIYSKVISKP